MLYRIMDEGDTRVCGYVRAGSERSALTEYARLKGIFRFELAFEAGRVRLLPADGGCFRADCVNC